MKFSMISAIALLLSTSSAWELRANNQVITGTAPRGCTSIFIPRGARISWEGSKGARTLQVFNVRGSCSQVYRTVMGVGDINASNDIYGYVVKPWKCTEYFVRFQASKATLFMGALLNLVWSYFLFMNGFSFHLNNNTLKQAIYAERSSGPNT